MLILSLDSAAQTASASLSEDECLLASVMLNIGNKHSTTLLPAASFLLSQAGRSMSDVKLIAATAGPGSFTGVRIGAAAVKGLAFGRDVPCIGVSSLETMARGLTLADGIVCPMINARRDRYFAAFFRAKQGRVTRLTDDDTLSGEEIENYLADTGMPVYLIGDGAEVYLRSHSAALRISIPEPLKYPSAYFAGLIAREMYEKADAAERRNFTADALRPIYLRQPQAERELRERTENNISKGEYHA